MPRAVRRTMTAAVEYEVARAGIAAVRALDRDVVGQAHHPRGAAGSVNGWVFAHRPSNRQRNRWAVSLLDVRPADQVLEIGFGPGLAIAQQLRAGAGAFQPRCHGATAGTSRNAADEIENLLRSAGFTQLSTETLPLSPPVICVIAAAPVLP
jgi:hypothetical protein